LLLCRCNANSMVARESLASIIIDETAVVRYCSKKMQYYEV